MSERPENPRLEDDDAEPSPRRERFGRYELVAELASGGMASVYLARLVGEAGVARVVAVKRIHPHLARDTAFAEMFLDEARIASRIDHPNVCHVLEYGREGGVSFLAMEFLAGEPMNRVLGRVAASAELLAEVRTPYVLAAIIAEACDGLHAAHELTDERGAPMHVVHRDVSPHNLFVTFDGSVKVVDFGIASAANKVHHTETGTVKGKFAYMSPEQLHGAKADRRVDVWAIGVVLWEALAASRLFRRESPSEVMRAVEDDPIQPPSAVRVGLPAAFDGIVLRALARDVDRRYATTREIARDLRTAIQASGHVVDRAAVADWMERLFPDGAARRREWLAKAAALDDDSARLRARGAAEARDRREAEETAGVELRDASTVGRTPRRTDEPAPAAPGGPTLWGGALALVALLAVGAGIAWWASRAAPRIDAHAVADAGPVRDAAASMDAMSPPALDAATAPLDATQEDLVPIAASEEVHARRTPRAPDASSPAAATEIPPSPSPELGRPACVTVGGGVAAIIDGNRHEGPRSGCLHLAPGAHAIRVERLTTGETLWTEEVTLESGERAAVTATALRRGM